MRRASRSAQRTRPRVSEVGYENAVANTSAADTTEIGVSDGRSFRLQSNAGKTIMPIGHGSRATRSAGIAITCFGCSTNAFWSSRSADDVVRTSGVNGRGRATSRLRSTGTTSSPNKRQPRSTSRTTSVLLPAPDGPASSITAPFFSAAPACSQKRCGCAAAKSAVAHFRTKYMTCSREPATCRPAES